MAQTTTGTSAETTREAAVEAALAKLDLDTKARLLASTRTCGPCPRCRRSG